MESVIFDGKEYTKASVLAEKFRYTADYLGQLCRGKKVDARLVGRAWYINLDSLLAHRDARYKTPESKNPAEISEKRAIHNYLSRIDVEPIIRRKTVRIVMNNKGAVTELPVKYEGDDQALIPRVQKNALSVSLPITPAGSERLRIHKMGASSTAFVSEPLPEVSLKGTLSVVGIPEVMEEIDEVVEDVALNKDMSPEQPKEEKPIAKPLEKQQAKVIFVRPKAGGRQALETKSTVPSSPTGEVTVARGISFKPNSVIAKGSDEESEGEGFMRVVSSLLLALLVASFILTFTLDTVVKGSQSRTEFSFTLTNLKELLR